jgi:hypothetical protein
MYNHHTGASAPPELCCKEMVIYITMWAHPPPSAGDRAFRGSATAPAPPAAGLNPSNPLREPKPLRGFGFAEFHCVKLLETFGWSLGQSPKLRKPKRYAFWFPLRGRKPSAFASPKPLREVEEGSRKREAGVKPFLTANQRFDSTSR